MLVEVDSQDEDHAAGNELLGVGAGLGSTAYTTAYTTSPSAPTSSAYNVAYSTTLAASSSTTSDRDTAGYDNLNQNIGEDDETYSSTNSFQMEEVSSIAADLGPVSSSTITQSQSSQAQETYEQPTGYYAERQPDALPISADYEHQVTSTSAMPAQPQVESILDHSVSHDQKGKRVTSYLVSWAGGYDDSWVTDKEIPQEWISSYNKTRRERREGKGKVKDTEPSPTTEVEGGEEDEDLLYGVHQAQVERSRRDSSGATSSRLESRKKNNKDRNKGKKRTWF